MIGTYDLAGMQVEIIDPVADYVEMMRELVDFDRIRALFASGFQGERRLDLLNRSWSALS